jgi:hypothetical protein
MLMGVSTAIRMRTRTWTRVARLDSPWSLLVAILVYSLVSGAIALALTSIIGAVVEQPGLRRGLELFTAITVVVGSGVACLPLLARWSEFVRRGGGRAD